jgi:hypothetical protein
MEPIRYEQHCARCHPLSVRLAGEFRGPQQEKLDAAVRRFNAEPAVHREPAVVRAMMRERMLSFVQEFPVVLGERSGALVEPETFRPRQGRPHSPTDVEWRWAREQLTTVERLLFPEQQIKVTEHVLFRNAGGCRFCHVEKGRGKAGAELDALPVYELSALPQRWLGRSRFSHSRHRMLDCTECHDALQSSRTSDVLMPRLETCQQCHNPRQGARHDCVECHPYHDRSIKHDLHKRMGIGSCLGP